MEAGVKRGAGTGGVVEAAGHHGSSPTVPWDARDGDDGGDVEQVEQEEREGGYEADGTGRGAALAWGGGTGDGKC
jgi:hypothetical protein